MDTEIIGGTFHPTMVKTDQGKICAKRITIARAEGLHEECVTVTFTPTYAGAGIWKAAETLLAGWEAAMPKDRLGYDKCDFEVEFYDGEVYKGRYDCGDEDDGLAGHILGFMRFYAGLNAAWCSPEQYREVLATHERTEPGVTDASKRWLATYQIGD